MNTAVIVTKIDPQTKKRAQEKAEEFGMPLSVIIKGLLKQFIRTNSISFSTEGEYPSEYLKAAIKDAEENYRKGNTSPAFDNAKDAIKYLEDQGI